MIVDIFFVGTVSRICGSKTTRQTTSLCSSEKERKRNNMCRTDKQDLDMVSLAKSVPQTTSHSPHIPSVCGK